MTPPDEPRYTPDEVSDLIRAALARQEGGDTISHEELIEIAQKSGVSRAALERAIDERGERRAEAEARDLIQRRRRRSFNAHLRSYLIVNGALLAINLFTGAGELWVKWPALSWGIFLAFHASSTFFPNERKTERSVRALIRSKQGRRGQ